MRIVGQKEGGDSKIATKYRTFQKDFDTQLSTLKKSDFYRKSEWDKVISSIFLMIVYFCVLFLTVDAWTKRLYEFGDYNSFNEVLILLAISIPSAISLWTVKAMRIPESINPKLLFLISAIATACLYGLNISIDSGVWAVRSMLTIWLVDIGMEEVISFFAHLIHVWREYK